MKEHPIYKEYLISEDGQVYSLHKNTLRKPVLTKHGYLRLFIHTNQNIVSCSIHRLVAETYIPNPENKPEVNHINGVKTDNRVENLEWVTSKENKTHAISNGLYDSVIGENHCFSTISDDTAKKICQCLEDGMRNKDIANMFGVTKDMIANIKAGRSYRHISKKYTFNKTRKDRKSVKTILKIASLLEQGCDDKEVSEMLNVKRSEVARIRRREIYKDLISPYKY